MRYIRNFVIVFTLFLCLAGMSRPRATDPLFTVTGCNDPGRPCVTTGDGVNTVIHLTKTQEFTSNIIGFFVGKETAMSWLGILEPSNNIYRNANDKLNTLGNQIQLASDYELNPAQLQDAERHDESSKAATMTSRVCVVDPQTGKMVSAVSKTTILSADQPWLRTQGEGSRRLSSFTTGYVQESQDYRLPDTTIKEEAAVPCESPLQGEVKSQQIAVSQGLNDYQDSGSGLGQLLYKIVDSMVSLLYNPQGSPSGEKATVTAQGTIVGTAQNPYAGHVDALTAGCASSSDMNDLSYASDEQKQKLCAAGGFVNSMYRQDAIDPTYKADLDANDPNQEWHQTVANSQPRAELSNAFAGRVEAAGDYMNCTLMPADYQTIAGMSDTCNKNWVGSSATGGWNCNTGVPEQSVTGLNSDAGQSYADRVYGSCANGKDNAWKLCKNDVIARAVKACVNPLFALAIWLHESGASNYTCGRQLSGGSVQDFGINIQSVAENFSEQLDRFLKLPASYAATCPSKTMRDFVAMYWIGDGCYNSLSSENKAKIDGYINELQLIYSVIAPGVSFPTWPAGC